LAVSRFLGTAPSAYGETQTSALLIATSDVRPLNGHWGRPLRAYLASFIAAYFGEWPLVIAWDVAIIGAAASLFLGLVVGIVPAIRAARLEPIAALRTV
jgi:ABC-type antimicrobial peptide transport system permease subunit